MRDEWIRISADGDKARWTRAWSGDGRPFLECIDAGRLNELSDEEDEEETLPALQRQPDLKPDTKQTVPLPDSPQVDLVGVDDEQKQEEQKQDQTHSEWVVNLGSDSSFRWTAYEAVVQQLLHATLSAGTQSSVVVKILGVEYVIDLSACVQRNSKTGFERPIRQLRLYYDGDDVADEQDELDGGFSVRQQGAATDVWTHGEHGAVHSSDSSYAHVDARTTRSHLSVHWIDLIDIFMRLVLCALCVGFFCVSDARISRCVCYGVRTACGRFQRIRL